MTSYSVAKMCLHFTNVYNIYVCACIHEIINYYSRMFRYLSLAFRPTCQVHLPEKAIFSHPPHSTNDFLSLFTPSPLYDPFPVHLDHFFSFIYTYHISRPTRIVVVIRLYNLIYWRAVFCDDTTSCCNDNSLCRLKINTIIIYVTN